MQRQVMSPDELTALMAYLGQMPLPFTVSVAAGKLRSIRQNDTTHKWYDEIARQRGDMTPGEVKCECKAYFGVPILMAEDAEFAATYERVIKPLPRETKLEAMHILPVTSRMTTKQLARYMDEVFRNYTQKGFVLTDPEAKR